MNRNHLASLSQFVANLTYTEIPPDVVTRIKYSVLDTLGCGIYGNRTQWGRIIGDYAAACEGTSALWGRSETADLEHAVMANATMVHSFELDDLHLPSRSHPGGITVPVALALAEAHGGVSGSDFIASVAAGYEVLIRVGMAQGVSSFNRGWHPTGTAGPFGAAATASRLLRLSVNQTQDALGIAGTMPCGLMAAQYGAMVKRLYAGHASSTGVLAARLAQKGFTGIPDIFDAEFGGYLSAVSDESDASYLTSGLGTSFRILETGYKLYSCVGASHTAIDATRRVLETHGLGAANIRSVRVVTSEYQRTHAGWQYVPGTVMAAQMSIQYCVAAMVLFRDVFVDQFTEQMLVDDRLLDLAQRVNVEADVTQSPHDRRAMVEVTLIDGTRLSATSDFAKGHPDNPATWNDISSKFLNLASKVLPESTCRALVTEVEKLEECDDVTRCVQLLKGGR